MTAKIQIIMEKDDIGTYRLEGYVEGSTRECAEEATQLIYKVFTSGRLTFMRVAPDVETYTDFDTKITTHRGYVRFHFQDKPGEIHHSNEFVRIKYERK